MKKVLVAVLSVVAMAVAVGLSGTSSAMQYPGANGQITYSKTDGQTQQRTFYSVNPDGTGSTTVIPASTGWSRPVYAPNNSKIARVFTGTPNTLVVENPDLTGSVTVATAAAGGLITDFFFNRDSTGLYYVRTGSSPAEIHFVLLDGTGDTVITTFAAGLTVISVNISPDGTTFAVATNASPSPDATLLLRPVAGGADTTIATVINAAAGAMSFSPDGTKLMFSETPASPSGTAYLKTINIDGTGLTTVASVANEQYYGAWSPDGTKIAYLHRPNPNGQNNEIWVANPDGSSPILIVGPSGSGELFAGVNWRLNGAPTPLNPTTTVPASDPVVPAFTG